MEFKEFVNKVIDKINNFDGEVNMYNLCSRNQNTWEITFNSCKTGFNSIYLYYKDNTVTINLNALYTFTNISILDWEAMIVTLRQHVREYNKRELDNFLGI